MKTWKSIKARRFTAEELAAIRANAERDALELSLTETRRVPEKAQDQATGKLP